MEQTFEEYLKQARLDFAKVAEKYPVEKHLKLRTAIDSLLIAYDQAVYQVLSLGGVVGRSGQLVCEYCNDDAKPTCCDKCLEGMVNAVQKASNLLQDCDNCGAKQVQFICSGKEVCPECFC